MISQGFDGTLLDDVLEYYFQVTVPSTDSGFRAAVAERAVAMRELVMDIRSLADYEVTQRDGVLNQNNRFKLIVNGAPYLPQDALNSEDINLVKNHTSTQSYLGAIDLMLVENYVSQDLFYVDYVKNVYGNGRISFLSIDTDQVTEQQRLQTITKAVHLGFMPYTTENTEYDTLNLPFFQELSQDSVNAGNDTLSGGDGNDTLDGGAGVDLLTGGVGADIFRFSDATHSKRYAVDRVMDFEVGIDKIDVTSLQVTDITKTANSAGKLYIFTWEGNTYITNTELNLEVRIEGNKTAQLQKTVFIFGGIVGTANSETLVGTGAADTVRGLAGNDVLYGDNMNDTMFGGDGNDTLDGGQGADSLIGGNGADRFRFYDPTHSVFGAPDVIDDFEFGRDKIDVSNLIISNIQKSNTTSSPSMLRITTWQGDTYVSSHQLGFEFRFKGDVTAKLSASDFILGGIVGSNNTDVLYGTTGNDTIRGHGGNDTIYANAGNDTLIGGSGNDSLNAAEGADVLYGEDGNDTLDSGLGKDTMYGGAGADTFRFFNVSHSLSGSVDRIMDFQVGQDKIDLSDIAPFNHVVFYPALRDSNMNTQSPINGVRVLTWQGNTYVTNHQLNFEIQLEGDLTSQLTSDDFIF